MKPLKVSVFKSKMMLAKACHSTRGLTFALAALLRSREEVSHSALAALLRSRDSTVHPWGGKCAPELSFLTWRVFL